MGIKKILILLLFATSLFAQISDSWTTEQKQFARKGDIKDSLQIAGYMIQSLVSSLPEKQVFSEVTDTTARDFLLWLEINDDSPYKNVILRTIERDYNGTYKVLLGTYENETYANYCMFSSSSYTEPNELNGSRYAYIESTVDYSGRGATFRALVDWSQAPYGVRMAIDLGTNYINSSLLKLTETRNSFSQDNISNNENRNYSLQINNKALQAFQPFSTNYNHIIIYGQSLSVGLATPFDTVAYKNNKMIGDDLGIGNAGDSLSLYPLVQPSNAENLIVPAINSFKKYYDLHTNYSDTGKVFIATSTGTGGTSIEHLSKNSPISPENYEKFLTALTLGKQIATDSGATIGCPAIIFIQGEANAGSQELGNWDGTGDAASDSASYRNYLEQLYFNMVYDVDSIYSQDYDPLFFIYQTQDVYSTESGVAKAQLAFANEHSKVILYAPCYQVKMDESTHPNANGYRWMGEDLAKIMRRTFLYKRNFSPLQPKSILKLRDNLLQVNFIIPEPPLQIDTLSTAKVEDFGFAVYDDATEIAIDTVIVYDTFVQILLTEDLTGDVAIAYANKDVVVSSRASNNKSYGNLCDSDDSKSFTFYTDDWNSTEYFVPLDEDSVVISGSYPIKNFGVSFYVDMGTEDEIILTNWVNADNDTSIYNYDAGTFKGTSTYSWTPYGNNTVQNVSNEMKLTYVDAATGGYVPLNIATNLKHSLVPGGVYKLYADLYVNTGAVSATVNDGSTNIDIQSITSTSKSTYSFDFTVEYGKNYIFKLLSMGGSEIIYADNIRLIKVK